MASFTDYAENAILDHLFGQSGFTQPTLYLALFTADPTDAGVQTNELSNANGYSRTELTSAMNSAAGGWISNGTAITSELATADWATVTHIGLMDSATYGAGNMLVHGALDSSVTVLDTNSFAFDVGQFVTTLD